MKSDIPVRKVEDVAIGIAYDTEGDSEAAAFKVFLINLKDAPLTGIIVNSRGYGTLDGKEVKTSTLRQFFDELKAKSYVEVELLPRNLQVLSNEFWISFWYDDFMFDKKYVFVQESIIEKNFIDLPIVGQRGVMIK